MPDRAIFLHIPKTAGTTLYNVLNRQYRFSRIYSIREVDTRIEDFRELPESTRSGYKLLRGHMPFGLHKSFADQVRYFTLLREPVDRVISLYYFVVSDPNHYQHKVITSRKLDLKSYVEFDQFVEADNCQVRYLSDAWYNVPYGQLTEDHLQQAKRNINRHFEVVGLMEHFDASLLLLQRAFDWRIPPYYVRTRINNQRPKWQNLNPDTLKTIRKHNRLDIALYEWAAQRFHAQFKALGQSYQARLAQFKAINPRVSLLVKLYQESRKVAVRTWLRDLFQSQFQQGT